jgi:type IV secretory pathway VirJ component
VIARAFATAAFVLQINVLVPAQTSQTVSLRGHDQQLRIYGVPAGEPVIVSSGDGGWTHLGPHIAETLSQRGFCVTGFDARLMDAIEWIRQSNARR